MSAIVSTDFLLRVAQATPEQQAAIEHLLADGEQRRPNSTPATAKAAGLSREKSLPERLARIDLRLDLLTRKIGLILKERPDPQEGEALSDEALRRIYAQVLLAAQGEEGWREAPIRDVFDYYCVKGLSAHEVALKLGCSKGTVLNRLAALERLAGVPVKHLRAYKPFFEQTEEALRDPRARRVRRKDASYGDDPDAEALE